MVHERKLDVNGGDKKGNGKNPHVLSKAIKKKHVKKTARKSNVGMKHKMAKTKHTNESSHSSGSPAHIKSRMDEPDVEESRAEDKPTSSRASAAPRSSVRIATRAKKFLILFF